MTKILVWNVVTNNSNIPKSDRFILQHHHQHWKMVTNQPKWFALKSMRKVFFSLDFVKFFYVSPNYRLWKKKFWQKFSGARKKMKGNAFSLFICFDLFIFFCFVSSKCLIELRRKAAPGFHFCCFDESKFVIVITQAKTNEKQCRQAMNNIWEF